MRESDRQARRKRAVERSKAGGYRQEKGLVPVALTLSQKIAKEACERCALCGGKKVVTTTNGPNNFTASVCPRCLLRPAWMPTDPAS